MDGKRLYKSSNNALLTGVLGGIAEYFNMEPIFLRFIFILLCTGSMGGELLILYAILTIIIPNEPPVNKNKENFKF